MAWETDPLPQDDRMSGPGAPSHDTPPKALAPRPSWGAVGHSCRSEIKETERGCVLGERNLQFTITPWGLTPPPLSGQSGRVVFSLRTRDGGALSLARFPPFPLVPSPASSATSTAGKGKQVKWLPSVSPAAGPGYLRGPWGSEGRLGCKCL